MQRSAPACGSLCAFVTAAVVITCIVPPASAAAQVPAPPSAASSASMAPDEISAFAKVHLAIAQAHDSIEAELAQPRNKTVQAQTQLQGKMRAQIDEILHHAGMTADEYRRKTYVISSDSAARKTFDGVIAQLTGTPTPGQVVAVAAPGGGRGSPPVHVPAGAAGTHIGHIVNAFAETPGGLGLLPMALAEARIAAQHAALAARNPANLEGMKLHAGHVIHALDPAVVTAGPGKGYGVKRASLGIAMHIELAAKAPGASANVIMHATLIATAAKSAAQRTDQIIELAKQVQAATAVSDAAALVRQMVAQCDQLNAAALQQVQDQMNIMLAAEPLPPR